MIGPTQRNLRETLLGKGLHSARAAELNDNNLPDVKIFFDEIFRLDVMNNSTAVVGG